MVIERESWVERRPLFGAPPYGRLLTISEAANLLSAHPNSVRRWADMGLLPSYRFGQRKDRRFRVKDIASFLVSEAPPFLRLSASSAD